MTSKQRDLWICRRWTARGALMSGVAAVLMASIGCSDEPSSPAPADALVYQDVGDTGRAADDTSPADVTQGDVASGDTTVSPDAGASDATAPDTTSIDTKSDDTTSGDTTSDDTTPTDAAASDTDDTSAGDADASADTTADAGPAAPLYLLSFGAPTSGVIGPSPGPKPVPGKGTVPLYKIDVTTGTGKTICTLQTSDSYPSSTFGRDGKLYGSNNTQDRLDIIDPCSCKVTAVGKFGYSFIPGITSDQGVGLFGMENTVDILVAINPKTGKATKIGSFGINFGTGGATWSDTLGGAYAIDGTSDSLYTLDSKTGKASLVVKLNKDFGTVGIELHPANDTIYACTSDAILYTVDPKTGAVSPIGKLPHKTACNNLAAPWSAVACLEKP